MWYDWIQNIPDFPVVFVAKLYCIKGANGLGCFLGLRNSTCRRSLLPNNPTCCPVEDIVIFLEGMFLYVRISVLARIDMAAVQAGVRLYRL